MVMPTDEPRHGLRNDVPPARSRRHSFVGWHAAGRTSAFCAAAALVDGAMYFANGAPSLRRRVLQSEIARFSPTLGHGLFQLLGETMLVVLHAWICRRWLKVRL
jgi:hypothetical protein